MQNSIRKFIQEIPYGEIWGLVWPQTMMMFCTIVVSLTDMWVGGKIDDTVQASIGVTAQLQAFFMVIATSIGTGAMAAVSQANGAKRYLRAKRYTNLIIVYALSMAIIVAFIGYFFRHGIMGLLQVPDTTLNLALVFFTFVLGALPAQCILFVAAILFRANRDVISPLLVVSVVAIINVFGDLGFGLGYFGMPVMGGLGIIGSTFVAFYVGAIMSFLLMIKRNLFAPHFLPAWKWIKRAAPYLIKVTTPAIIMQTLWQVGYLTLFSIMASLPNSTSALAGMATGMRIEAILFMPAVAFNVTASIMVGNALGANNLQEAKRIGLAIVVFGASIMSLIGLCMYPFVDILGQIFSKNPETEWNIVMYLTINIASTPFTVGGMIVNGIMTGAGATIYALYINTFCIWCVRLPLAYGLAHYLGYGPIGVYFAMLFSMAVQASSMFYIFIKHNWHTYAMQKCDDK